MNFAPGEWAFGHSFDPSSGREMLFFSFPKKDDLETVAARLAPDVDLSDWGEGHRETLGHSPLERLFRSEEREFVRFVRPA